MKIIISAFSNLSTDQRIEKTCHTLHQSGYAVHLIGCTWKGDEKIERDYPTEKIPIRANTLKLAYPEFNYKLYKRLKSYISKETILYCNDLDTLCANYLLAKKYKIPLIFDSHEIFTEMPALQGRFTQKIWKRIEKMFLPQIRYMLTASESYADWFADTYAIPRPIVVQNFPYRNFSFQEPHHNDDNTPKTILYQGMLNPSRGIDKLLHALHAIPNAILKIAGEGPEKENLQTLTRELNLQNRVMFLGKISPSKLKTITPTADVGVSIEENNGLSYYYSMPNKISDYIQAGIPVVTSHFPEMKRIVEQYRVGECILSHSREELSSKINRVLQNGKHHYKDPLQKAAHHICWENEAPKLLQIIKQVQKENFD